MDGATAVVEHVIELGISGLPEKLYAGLTYAFEIEAMCSVGCDLGGEKIVVCTQDGESIFDGPLVATERGSVFSTGPITAELPDHPGTYGWHMTFISSGSEDEGHDAASEPADTTPEPTSAPSSTDTASKPVDASSSCDEPVKAHATSGVEFALDVLPHAVSASVWGVKSPVPIGDDLTVEVGMECNAGCDLSGERVIVLNEYGDQVGEAYLASPTDPKRHLYQARVETIAPFEIGTYEWKAAFMAKDGDIWHTQAERRFSFATDEAGDRTLRIHIADGKSGNPVSQAIATLKREGSFPYRMRTDSDGHAEVVVPGGNYHLGIVKSDYDDVSQRIAIEDESVELEITMTYNPDPLG